MTPSNFIPVVIAPAANPNLIDLGTLKTLLGVTNGRDDAYFKLVIAEASAQAQAFANNPFVVQGYQDEFWPARDGAPWTVRADLDVLQLLLRPLTGVTSVVETIAGVATTLVAGTDYIANMALGQLIRLDPFGRPRTWHSNPVVVQYSAGYPTIPADVVSAISQMVKGKWYGRHRDPNVRSQSAPGVYEEALFYGTGPGGEGDLPVDVTATLLRYRIPVFA